MGSGLGPSADREALAEVSVRNREGHLARRSESAGIAGRGLWSEECTWRGACDMAPGGWPANECVDFPLSLQERGRRVEGRGGKEIRQRMGGWASGWASGSVWWMGLLDRFGPAVHVAEWILSTVEGEGFVLRPGVRDQVAGRGYSSRLGVGIGSSQKLPSSGVSTAKSATRRPPETTSSISNSSPTRIGGSPRAMEFPIAQIAAREVLRAGLGAMIFGDGISP